MSKEKTFDLEDRLINFAVRIIRIRYSLFLTNSPQKDFELEKGR